MDDKYVVDTKTGRKILPDSSYAMKGTWALWECVYEDGAAQYSLLDADKDPEEHLLLLEEEENYELNKLGEYEGLLLDACRWRNQKMDWGPYNVSDAEFKDHYE